MSTKAAIPVLPDTWGPEPGDELYVFISASSGSLPRTATAAYKLLAPATAAATPVSKGVALGAWWSLGGALGATWWSQQSTDQSTC